MSNMNKLYQIQNKTEKDINITLYKDMFHTTLKPSGTLSTNIVFLKALFKEYESLFVDEDLVINGNIEFDELRETIPTINKI